MGTPARGSIPLPRQSLSHLVDHKFHDELLVFILVIPNEWHGGAHHLNNVIPSVLAMQCFHCADVKSPKNL